MFSALVFSNNTIPSIDGVKDVNIEVEHKVKSYFPAKKVEAREVEHLFRKNKRVERLFKANKKSIKRKFTIA